MTIGNGKNKYLLETAGGMIGNGGKFAANTPPSFVDAELLSFWDGSNSDATHKKDSSGNGLDMKAVEGPCLTLEIGDTMVLPMNDTPASNMGTAVFTYDGLTATVTTEGTIYKVMSTNGLEFPFNEGAGTSFRDRTGTYEGEIIANLPGTMWTENTQDDYFAAMEYGWYENDPDDGGQYIYDKTTKPYFNLSLVVSGLGSLTIDSIAYTAGTYVLENLFGPVEIIASYGLDEDTLIFTGDAVTGTYPAYSIGMDGNKGIVGTFSISAVNLVSNGDFATLDCTDWTLGNITCDASSGQAVLTNAGYSYIQQKLVGAFAGNDYRVTLNFVAAGPGTNDIRVYFGTAFQAFAMDSAKEVKTFDFLNVSNDVLQVRFQSATAGLEITIDDITTVEI